MKNINIKGIHHYRVSRDGKVFDRSGAEVKPMTAEGFVCAAAKPHDTLFSLVVQRHSLPTLFPLSKIYEATYHKKAPKVVVERKNKIKATVIKKSYYVAVTEDGKEHPIQQTNILMPLKDEFVNVVTGKLKTETNQIDSRSYSEDTVFIADR